MSLPVHIIYARGDNELKKRRVPIEIISDGNSRPISCRNENIYNRVLISHCVLRL